MLDFWFEIPCIFRAILAYLVLGYGLFACFTGYQSYEAAKADEQRMQQGPDMAKNARSRGQFEFGFLVTGIGITLVAISGRSRSEKNGYRSC